MTKLLNISALTIAGARSSACVQTSYCVLHTAPYYGTLSGKVLLRNYVSL